MKIHLAYLQHYERRYEQSPTNPVQCLILLKKEGIHDRSNCPILSKHNQFLVTELINKRYLMKLLFNVQILEKGNRHVEYKRLFRPMPILEVINSFKVKAV